MIWRGVGRGELEENDRLIRKMMELIVGKRVSMRRKEERKRMEGRTMLVELEDGRGKQDMMQDGRQIKRKGVVGTDEDLTMKERRRLMEKARVERRKGKSGDR